MGQSVGGAGNISMDFPALVSGMYDVRPIERARWNVLDLLNWISRKAVTAQMFCEIDTSQAEALLSTLSENGEKITITALLLKAISIAQLDCPESRSYRLPWGLKVVRSQPVAGFTVERLVDGRPAVFFASIANAHTKSLEEIAREISAYGRNDIDSVTQLAKEHLLSKVPWLLRQFYIAIGLNVPALRHVINPATFGLTSLGKFGMGAPCAPNVTTTIFGIGSMEPKVVARDNKVEVRNMMEVALSADLRILGFYKAAYLLQDIKTLVESGLAAHLTDDERDIVARAQAKLAVPVLSSSEERFAKNGRRRATDAA